MKKGKFLLIFLWKIENSPPDKKPDREINGPDPSPLILVKSSHVVNKYSVSVLSFMKTGFPLWLKIYRRPDS